MVLAVTSFLSVLGLKELTRADISSKFALEGMMEGLRQLLPASLFEGVYRRVFHLDATVIPTPRRPFQDRGNLNI